jgi:hypothetical protein
LCQAEFSLLKYKKYAILALLGCTENIRLFIFLFKSEEISNVFGIGTQEDASEFFTTLLESMAKSLRYSMGSANGHHVCQQSQLSKKFTIFDDIFSFQFRSRSN